MSNIELCNLTVMQDELRHTAQVAKMVEFVKKGGFWTQEVLRQYAAAHGLNRVCPPMEIIRFPDAHLMVHDGHHRAVSVCLGGRDYIREDEYVFKDWSYEDYLEINFPNRWVTPFDPRTHIRIANIAEFKKTALDLAATDFDAACLFIEENRNEYIKPRKVHGVKDLVQYYLERDEETAVVTKASDAEYFRMTSLKA